MSSPARVSDDRVPHPDAIEIAKTSTSLAARTDVRSKKWTLRIQHIIGRWREVELQRRLQSLHTRRDACSSLSSAHPARTGTAEGVRA